MVDAFAAAWNKAQGDKAQGCSLQIKPLIGPSGAAGADAVRGEESSGRLSRCERREAMWPSPTSWLLRLAPNVPVCVMLGEAKHPCILLAADKSIDPSLRSG
jgi:hypothetical protein